MQRKENTCPACHEKNSGVDRKKYWTREKQLVGLERSLKILVTAVTCALIAGIFFLPGPGGPGVGWILALPVFFHVAMWQTVSSITRKDMIFRPSIYWGAFAFLAGFAFTLVVLYYRDNFGLRRTAVYIASVFPASVLLGCLLLLSGSKFKKWKNKRIEKLQEVFGITPTEAAPPGGAGFPEERGEQARPLNKDS
jgi:hypothetical protein